NLPQARQREHQHRIRLLRHAARSAKRIADPSCQQCETRVESFEHVVKFPLLYEINTRCWLGELSDTSRANITLANVPDPEFARWQRLGFTHLWLMGVWPTGLRSRAISGA